MTATTEQQQLSLLKTIKVEGGPKQCGAALRRIFDEITLTIIEEGDDRSHIVGDLWILKQIADALEKEE